MGIFNSKLKIQNSKLILSMTTIEPIKLTSKDFATDQEVRWCPGCGDYSILKQVQTVLPDLGRPKEEFVFISGIGCSSRFPYYMETFGMHSIHGRATAIATGLKATRPELSVWIVTGDGDSMSIGGNHFIHLLRRNPDVNVLMFNNQIYGLTKGQYSPTSEQGKVTKSTPMGSIDHPFNPVALCLGADATFVARTMDRDPKHQQAMIRRGYEHKGTSMIEIYQNCNVFNDGAFEVFTEKASKKLETLMMEHGKPLVFGETGNKGIKLDGFKPVIVDVAEGSTNDLWIHDETDLVKATILSRFFDDPSVEGHFPRPFGVFYVDSKRPTFDDMINAQVETAITSYGKGDLDKLIAGRETWVVN
jgi:2-oxoglutarate ferredoxin oxidoreductase subunit beta